MALKEHFWGQKYTFKIKKPGSRANGRKAKYSDSHPKDENINHLKNL